MLNDCIFSLQEASTYSRAPSSQKTLKSVLLKVVSDFTLIQCSNANKKASSLFFICSQSVSSQGGSLTHISQSRHTMIFL